MQHQNECKLLPEDGQGTRIQLSGNTADFQENQEINNNDETLANEKGVSVQQAYEMIGGFGKFHWIASILLIMGFCSGQYIVALLGYLTLPQVYECSETPDFKINETEKCFSQFNPNEPKVPYFCGTNKNKRVVWEAETSLHNWYESLDLACRSKGEVGLIGSILFVGWTLAAFIFPRLADIHGRRLIFTGSMLVQTLSFLGLYFSRNIYVTYVFMFFLGTSSVGRCSVGYLYLMEILPKAQQVLTGTILQMFNQFTGLLGCLYFWKMSKDWLWLEIYACATGILSMVGVFMMPESPKFLVTIKKYDQTRLAINTIARINKSNEVFDSQFDREVVQRREKYQPLNRSEISMISENHISTNILSSPKAVIKEEKQLDGSLKDLLKIRRHLVNLILMIFFWVASSFSFYLVNYSIKNIKGDFFMNNLVSALTAIPISAVGGFLYYRLGVKAVFMIFFSIAVVGGIAIIIFSETQPDLVPIMVAFAKGGVQATFDICYLANSFLFPAIFAGTAFGICNAGAKISTILAPVLAEFTPPLPMIIFSILTSMGAVFPMFIKTEPEK